MKFNYSLFLICVIMGLLALSGCLFKQSTSYRQQNRELILENDSLISVNIELKKELEQAQGATWPQRKRATASTK